MSVRLRPMREDEFSAFVEHGKVEYARDMVENAGFTPEAAERKAEHDFKRDLPDGLDSEGHFVFAVEDADTGERVGVVWFARREVDGDEVAYVYDLNIDEHARGKGFGRDAMLALEDEVRRHGLERISLNVFGGNEAARKLYASLGYREVYVWMRKDLSSGPSSPS